MNSKIATIGIFAVLMCAALVGIAYDADGVAAEGPESDGAPDADTPVVPAFSGSVSYVVDGKTYTVPATSATIVLETIEKLGAKAPEHKTFDAWTTGGKTYKAGSTYIIESEDHKVTFDAKFIDTPYKAQFKAADGTVLKTVDGTFPEAKDLAVEAPAAPAIDGKIFAGWLADGAEKAVMTKDLGKLDSDVTYTATYVIDYKITFIDGDKTYITKVSDLVVPDLGERTGFTFLGWFIGVEQVAEPATYVFKADTTFTAKWEPMNVYVTFVAGSFETTVAVLYGQTVVVPELPAGYTAWDFDFSTPITEDKTIQAIEAAPDAPKGMSDPITLTIAILVGTLALAGCAGLVVLQRKGKIVIGRGPNAAKKSLEDKKE